MDYSIPKGTTSKNIFVDILDPTRADGGGRTGLLYNTAGLTCVYKREGTSGAAVSVPLVAGTVGSWLSGGFVEVSGMPGVYQVGVPDAALADGGAGDDAVDEVLLFLAGASDMAPRLVRIQLEAVNSAVDLSFRRVG